MIVDGKVLAASRTAELVKERDGFGPLTLGIAVMTEDAVTSSFLRIKNRVAESLHIAVTQAASLAELGSVDGVILQLPLPDGVDTDRERDNIPLTKDVDVLSDDAYQKFVEGVYPPPPVPRAMAYILKSHNIDVRGKKVVVIGQGRLVGKPAAALMRQSGAVVVTLEKGDDIASQTHNADIVILGAGEPYLLKPDMVKDGVIILDAGTSEAGGRVVGDADPACAEKAALFTPTPGGIGPIAVVEIFANLFELVRMH
jgi:methylenetetrahydrofolate dehydrogenase (NADP+)/methenyltetrahydrofolate cyclohydrolase